MSSPNKQFDIILFGATGFTGKLCVEYLLKKKYPITWAACARNQTKAATILDEIAALVSEPAPPLVIADLVCTTSEQEEQLRDVVKSTRVVMTAAGPFRKYGISLHKICAEEGIHYVDITGETSFFRQVIQHHDAKARGTKAVLVSHCGNDCIPHDLTVHEMHEYAKGKGYRLSQVVTYDEFPAEASFSGGTVTTSIHSLTNKPKQSSATDFDPLLRTRDGTKSQFTTKVTHKDTTYVPEFERKAGPWIMAPVMANCVRRSNALLGYSPELNYGDVVLQDPSWINHMKQMLYQGLIGAAIHVPPLLKFLPQPGEGPNRETMEAGYLKLYGRGIMINESGNKSIELKSLFHFHADTAYFMTAQMLVESGILLVDQDKAGSITSGGVLTPAVAFGSTLTRRITNNMQVTFELKEEGSNSKMEEV